MPQKYGVNWWIATHHPHLFITVTCTHATAIPKALKNTIQDVIINPWKKKKNNDLTIKSLPEEVTKF